MRNRPDPGSLRWRLAARVGPELVALGLVILVAIVILLLVWIGAIG